MFGFLAKLGQVGMMGSGASLLLSGIEHATGLPVHSALSDMVASATADVRSVVTPLAGAIGGPDLAALVDPSAQFRTADYVGAGDFVGAGMSPMEYADRERKRRRRAEKQLAQERANQAAAAQEAQNAEAQRVLDEANAKASAAEQKAAQLEAQLAKTKNAQKRNQLAFNARAARRWAATSRGFANQTQQAAQQGQAPDTVLQLALQALQTAQAAMNPPADARHILANDAYTLSEKSSAQDAIDTVNRDGDFDVNALMARLSSNDASIRESAEDEVMDMADLSGHDKHEHGHAHGAKGDCGCGCKGTGACKVNVAGAAAAAPVAGPDDDGWDEDDDAEDANPLDELAGADQGDDGGWEEDGPAPALAGGERAKAAPVAAKPTKQAAEPLAGEDDDGWDYPSTSGKDDAAFAAKLERMAKADEDCGCG